MHIFIFSHLDDEFGIFYQIEESIKSKKETYIIYVTTSSTTENIDQIRLLESIKSLKKLGVNENQLILLGNELNVPDLKIIDTVQEVYAYFEDFFEKRVNGVDTVFTHCYEGGHPDHDAVNLIIRKIKQKYRFNFKLLTFPLYHGKGLPWIFYKVMHPQNKSDNWMSLAIPFRQRFTYIKLLFNYKSQLKTLIGIAPFYILKMVFTGKQYLKKEIDFSENMPYSGRMLYDKRGMESQIYFKERVINKLSSFS